MRKYSIIITILIFSVTSVFAQFAKEKSPFEKINIKSVQKSTDEKMYRNQAFVSLEKDAELIAKDYLRTNSKEFRTSENSEDVKILKTVESPSGKYVYCQQLFNNIPVYGTNFTVYIDKENVVRYGLNEFKDLTQYQEKGISTKQQFTADDAVKIASDYLQIKNKENIIGEIKSELCYIETEDKGLELTWKINLHAMNPMGDWLVFISAIDKCVIHVEDITVNINGTGKIFNVNPLLSANATYGNPACYQHNNNATNTCLDAQLMQVTLRDISQDNNGNYILSGPYCIISDFQSFYLGVPSCTTTTGFQYTRDQPEFEAVMCYYHIDMSARYIDQLGYMTTGLESVNVDPHGLSGSINAAYYYSNHSIALGGGGSNVEAAEDADVILHEYGHALQFKLGVGVTGSSNEAGSLREGSSDYWATSHKRSIYPTNWEGMGLWFGHGTASRNLGQFLVYPTDYNANNSFHTNGQIWSSALMEIWGVLGRNVTDKLFLETHLLWGQNPSFRDAAAAFIQADINLYDGLHLCTILDVFTSRGLIETKYSITSSQTWSTPQRVTFQLTIPAGVTLTITSQVYFSPAAKITIEPGGRLNLYGGTLTSACFGDLWLGVELQGNLSDVTQSNSQGILDMNNGIIENAQYGLYVGCRSMTGTAAGYGGGGIVFAENSTFRNNKRAVDFQKFTRRYSTSSTNEQSNRSYFENCTFITDNNAFFSVGANDAMVYLTQVHGVSFKGCEFKDTKNKTALSTYGIGIYANNASVKLFGLSNNGTISFPPNPSVKNHFTGFGNAIVLKDAQTRASSIEWTNFENNNIAIYANTADKFSVISCEIDVNSDDGTSGRHGIYAEYCDGYKIENNIFKGYGTGLYIHESGIGNNLIRYNTFKDMCLSNLATGENGETSNNNDNCTGLQYKCNKFEEDAMSILSKGSIRYIQGSPYKGTGNIFNNSSSTFVALENTSSYSFKYFYNNTIANHYPLGVSTNHFYIDIKGVSSHSCPCGIGYAGDNYYLVAEAEIPREWEELEVAYSELAEGIGFKKSQYNELYGSEELNWADFITIDGEAINMDDFPQIKLYTEIAELAEEIHLVCSEAFTIILGTEVLNLPVYRTWLLRENKINSDLLVAISYVKTGDWDKTEQTMNDMRTRYPELMDDDYANYLTYLEYLYQLENEDSYEITDEDIETISWYLEAFKGIAKAKMQALWERLTGDISGIELDDNCLCADDETDPDAGEGQKSTENTQKEVQSMEEKDYTLSVYPNPFGDVIQLRLDNASNLNMEQVQVYDITGRMLHIVNNIGNARTTIQLSDLSNGVYLIHVLLNNRETKVTRVFKQ
jgi:hypothetical protein